MYSLPWKRANAINCRTRVPDRQLKQLNHNYDHKLRIWYSSLSLHLEFQNYQLEWISPEGVAPKQEDPCRGGRKGSFGGDGNVSRAVRSLQTHCIWTPSRKVWHNHCRIRVCSADTSDACSLLSPGGTWNMKTFNELFSLTRKSNQKILI